MLEARAAAAPTSKAREGENNGRNGSRGNHPRRIPDARRSERYPEDPGSRPEVPQAGSQGPDQERKASKVIEHVWWAILYFRALLRHCGWNLEHVTIDLIYLFIAMREAALI